jgi:hypothetical protein
MRNRLPINLRELIAPMVAEGVVVAGLVVVVGLVMAGVFNPPFPRQLSEVKETFRAAVIVSQIAGYVDPRPRSLAEAKLTGAPTHAQLDRAKEKGLSDLATYFTSPIAKTMVVGLNNVIDAQEDPNQRLLGAGVSSIDFRLAVFDLHGDRAIVKAQITLWASGAQTNPDGNWAEWHTKNDVEVTAQLTKQDSGSWLVTSFRRDFAFGSGP